MVVIKKTINPNNKSKRVFWECKCDCGNKAVISTSSLVSGKSWQCWSCAHKTTGLKRRKDLTGQRFGKLVVQKMIYSDKPVNGRSCTVCECLCDCGNIVIRKSDSLSKDKYCSCGCGRKETAARFSKNVVGQKFGKLTVIQELAEHTPRKLLCKCECGSEITIPKSDVMSGHTLSCGCLRKEHTSISNTKDWSNYVSDYGIKAIKQVMQNDKGQWLWEYECPLCGNHFIALPARIASGHMTSCGCRKQYSKEQLIREYLILKNVDFISQYSFQDCRYKYKLKFDFALFKDGRIFYLIEYDGQQHYKPIDFYGGEKFFEKTIIRDKIKSEYCAKNNIPLLRLKYNLTDEEIKEQLANIIYP